MGPPVLAALTLAAAGVWRGAERFLAIFRAVDSLQSNEDLLLITLSLPRLSTNFCRKKIFMPLGTPVGRLVADFSLSRNHLAHREPGSAYPSLDQRAGFQIRSIAISNRTRELDSVL